MLSINDVVKIDDKRKQIRKEIYMKIYTQFSTKIKQSVELGHKQLFMTIPTFLIGYPAFDRSAAARYVARQFTLGGFTVQLVSDYDIYITWSKPKKKKEKGEQDEEEGDFPNLMNLKKIANKYRRSA
jgi:hypothetical protein